MRQRRARLGHGHAAVPVAVQRQNGQNRCRLVGTKGLFSRRIGVALQFGTADLIVAVQVGLAKVHHQPPPRRRRQRRRLDAHLIPANRAVAVQIRPLQPPERDRPRIGPRHRNHVLQPRLINRAVLAKPRDQHGQVIQILFRVTRHLRRHRLRQPVSQHHHRHDSQQNRQYPLHRHLHHLPQLWRHTVNHA